MAFTLNCPYTSSTCPILAPYAEGTQGFPRATTSVPGFPNGLQPNNRGCGAQLQAASPVIKQTSIHPASTLVDAGPASAMRDDGGMVASGRSGYSLGPAASGGEMDGGVVGSPVFQRQLSEDDLHDADAGDGTGGSTAFISKLYHLCSHPDYGDFIRWNNAGDAFIFVQGNQHFANSILPRFFRHSNVSSFIRQLNLYSFTRLPTIQLLDAVDNSTSAPTSAFSGFSHPHFRRGDEAALALIKPKSGKKARGVKKAVAGVQDKVKRAETGRGWSAQAGRPRSR